MKVFLLIFMILSTSVGAQDPASMKAYSIDSMKLRIPGPNGVRFTEVVKNGDVQVYLYSPSGKDLQKPHDRDELYFVVSGSGTFYCSGKRIAFEAGDCLLVPAHAEHRFERFSEDLTVWVVFYGAEKKKGP